MGTQSTRSTWRLQPRGPAQSQGFPTQFLDPIPPSRAAEGFAAAPALHSLNSPGKIIEAKVCRSSPAQSMSMGSGLCKQVSRSVAKKTALRGNIIPPRYEHPTDEPIVCVPTWMLWKDSPPSWGTMTETRMRIQRADINESATLGLISNDHALMTYWSST